MKRIAILLLFITTPVAAQQAAPSATEQAMATKLMQEIQGGLNCSASQISLQAELAKAQARIKELETKPKE